MSNTIPTGTTPATLKRLCIARIEATTGRRWRELTETQRAKWMAETEPVVREEEHIAADAVWRDGTWAVAGQFDLFADLPPAPDTESEAPA